MNSFITICCFYLHFNIMEAYIYHNHLALKMPYDLCHHPRTSKDIKIIDEDDAYKLSTFWYEELKYQQQYDGSSLQNIELLYTNTNDDYLKMNQMMTFHYNLEKDEEKKNEYLVWKPKVKPQFMNEQRQNSIFYPCFRQTMCLICFQRSYNDIHVDNLIYTPFWKGDINIIQKKAKSTLIDYFLGYLKHRELHFHDNLS